MKYTFFRSESTRGGPQIPASTDAERQLYRELFDIAPGSQVVLDSDGVIREANRAAAALFDVPQTSLVGQTLDDVVARLPQPQAGIELARARQSERHSWIVLLPTKGDEPLPVTLTATPMRDSGGYVTGFHCVIHNVVEENEARRQVLSQHAREQERTLAALQRHNTQLETIAEVSHFAGSILDPDVLIQRVTNLIKERFGLYYVGLFLVDQSGAWSGEPGRWAVLKAGTGEAGEQMVRRGHRLEVSDTSMVGWCIHRQKPRIALDIGEDALRFPNPMLPETRSELALPLISRSRPIGALTVQSTQKDAFTQEDIVYLSAMADQLANAITNAQLYEQAQREIAERERVEHALRQQTRELALINQASRTLTSTLDLDMVLVTLLEEIRRLMGVVAASVWLQDPDTKELVCRQATGQQQTVVRGWRLRPGEGLAGWVAQEGQSLIVADALADARHYPHVAHESGLPLRSILTLPLRTKKGILGVLQVVDTEVSRFDKKDVNLLEPLAATAAIAIDNARLYEQAQRDAETKTLLLHEANHRVKNILTAIVGLLYAEKRHAGVENQETYQVILADLISRVQGLAAVHSMLTASQWQPLLLSDMASRIIHTVLHTLPQEAQVSVNVSPSPTCVTPDQARHLTMVLTELTTNAVKHRLPEQGTVDITVDIDGEGDTVTLTFKDNGPGYPEPVARLEQHNVGFNLIKNIVSRNLGGTLSLSNQHGAVASIRFRTAASNQGA
ncbi:MAG: GAF domain-containing protein [Anaerolineae bacterium]|nr:GAF domain-containing protein [Anaerolineae bacterium]